MSVVCVRGSADPLELFASATDWRHALLGQSYVLRLRAFVSFPLAAHRFAFPVCHLIHGRDPSSRSIGGPLGLRITNVAPAAPGCDLPRFATTFGHSLRPPRSPHIVLNTREWYLNQVGEGRSTGDEGGEEGRKGMQNGLELCVLPAIHLRLSALIR